MRENFKLSSATNLFFIILFAWYSIIFFDVPLLTTEGRANLISIYGLLELLLAIILAGYLLHWKYIHYSALIILGLWGYLQFNANWKYIFTAPSEEKIHSYYQHFEDTLRIFPESNTIIIPDAYHIILGLLLLINIILASGKIINRLL